MLEKKASHLELPDYGMIYQNSFKNRLDRHWSAGELFYNYKAALPGSHRAFHGIVEYLTTEATAYGQEEPK